MKAKIIIVGQISEQLVATFTSPADAHTAAAMLQACTEDENLIYYVEYKGRRQAADSLSRRLPFLSKHDTHNCKLYFNS